jgi:hypothetical protein
MITLPDVIMSTVAMFILKSPSLLAFQEKRNDENMKSIFKIERVPSDTEMRKILDRVDPKSLYPLFTKLFSLLQR